MVLYYLVTTFVIMLQVETFFARLIQRVSPKSFAQAVGEVTVTQKFLENFSGDQVFETLLCDYTCNFGSMLS